MTNIARFTPALATLALTAAAAGADFFVAPAGSDAAAGTRDAPFATVQRAQTAADPGDTVVIRGGTYAVREDQVARRRGGWAYVTDLDKSGESGKPIRYWAADGERPVFDFSAVKPAGLRVHAFQVSGSWVHVRGLEVTGVQVTATGHTQSVCFANDGSHNLFERLSMHDGQAIGFYGVRGSDNLVLNCDAYRNHDFTSENKRGGNVDGFGYHPAKGATGNVFRGCRAWFNSDDGFDCINSAEAVTFEDCWAFYNGYSPTFDRLADGNGFKAGGYGSTPVDRLPNPVPRHVVRGCLAARNRSSGFYANHHIGGGDWFNNSAFRNGIDFNMLCRLPDNRTDVDGYGHVLRNNLAYRGGTRGGAELAKLDSAKSKGDHNSFDLGLRLADKDFGGLDEADLVRPRKPDGSLPDVPFMHLADGSAAIDAGADAGRPFRGARPDLGAFER